MEYNIRNIFIKDHAGNKKGIPDLFLFKKALYKIKASGKHLIFNKFWESST